MSFTLYKNKPSYNNSASTTSRYNKNSFKSSNKLTRARYFIKNILKDNSIITTTSLGKEVYNLKIKESLITIGYLGYLVNRKKLNSLISYLINLGGQYNLKDFFILISYPLEEKFFYLIVGLMVFGVENH